MVVAYPEYRFFVSGYGVSVYDKRGRRVGLFATEAEAINYLNEITDAPRKAE